MASYQQGNDYQTFQTNPYQLPTQQIIQAIQTRNQFWDSGASMLKNAYQNYLNLDLTRSDNHERLNQLMQGVNENLQKVSKTDLSLGENYGQALSIFDPIIKDDNIMGDNAITRHYKQEFSVGQNYRTKDNGKLYSETNMRDLSNHLQDFASDPNASNWRQHYASRASYTPYTDVAAEIRTVAKDFKPDTKSLTAPVYIDPTTGQPTTNGKSGILSGRMLTETDKSIVASQYRAFMDAHLSDKAKNQLAIEGRVKYHDNIGALAQDYSGYNQNKIDAYKTEIERLKGMSAGTNASPAQKEIFSDQIKKYNAQINDLNLENTKMKAGDFSNILPYKNQIAGSIHTNNYLDYLSKASSQHNVDIKYTPDQVWKTMFQQENENKRFNIAKEVQLQIAREHNQTQLTIKGIRFDKNGQPLVGIPTYGTADKSNNEQFGIDELNRLRDVSGKEFSDAVSGINKKIQSDTGIDVTDSKIPVAQREAASQQWLTNHKNDYDVKQYYAAAQKKNIDDMTFQAIDDYVTNRIQKESPELFDKNKTIINSINSGDNLRITDVDSKQSNYLNLSKDDIQKILNGTHPTIKLDKKTEYSQTPGYGIVPIPVSVNVLKYNGKTYDFTGGTLATALSNINKAGSDLSKKRADILNQNITRISGIENLFQDDKNIYYKQAHNVVLNKISGSASVIKNEDVRLTKKDADGDVYFKVAGDPHISQKDVKNKVEAAGGRYDEADDEYILPGKYFGDITKSRSFNDSRLASMQKLIDFRSSATPNDRFSTPPTTWGNRNFTFKVDLEGGHPTYRIVDPVSGAVFGQADDGSPFSTLDAAASQASLLGNLPTDQYLNFVRTIGKVPDYQIK